MKKVFLFILLTMQFFTVIQAQDIVGRWRTVSNIVENTDGSSKDLRLMQLKLWPCMADIETVFEAGGRQYTKSEKKCGKVDYNKLGNATWKMNGNTISITADAAMPNPLGSTATYIIAVANNTATFTHVYTSAEKTALHNTKIKKVTITYKKV
jgi:hypothetical protein